MKAVLCTSYGPSEVLRLAEVDKPTPKDNEVQIRVRAATVTAGDCELRRSQFPIWLWPIARMAFGIRGPRKKILGQELAGIVESVGKDVRPFREGDHVFAATGIGLGAYAEYKCMSEDSTVVKMPSNASFEEAAALPIGGLTALHHLREASIVDGQRVLINGAGGSIGTFAVQMARSWGGEVTAVDSSEKLDMLSSIGADHVIDYAVEDFTKNGRTYDVIFDVVGKTSISACMRSLNDNGYYLQGNPGLLHMVRGRTASRKGKKVITSAAHIGVEDLLVLRDLMEEGRIRSVIDRIYPLERIVEAHGYVETGHKKGNVVITVGIG